MGIADLLAGSHGASEEAHGEPDGDEMGSDPKELAQAAVEAFFEAGRAGDYAAAAEHLATAMEHCEAYGGAEEPEGEGEGEGKGLLILAKPRGKS